MDALGGSCIACGKPWNSPTVDAAPEVADRAKDAAQT
jgi:hypothetical protein